MKIQVRPAEAENWPDVLEVFGSTGDPSWCKCQYFIDEQWNQGAAANEAALEEQVCSDGVPAGLIAYADDQPAGWLQVGPAARFPRFKPRGHLVDSGVWVATCFVVKEGFRRRRIAASLLEAAVEHAQSNGARVLRARPTDTSITAKDSAGLFTGVLSTFTNLGFQILNKNRSLTLVELDLRDA
ncbi:N-acetyltransferase [Glutamicibacter uratoxydans]|uniref:N-acetyltransferase n=1 Tax=Glutamicibacter uratoxydans TaxID=43667 RepID=A0A4Y4DMB4_GLUUR|nr:GNAT family N-acetyltransferase [Glutamicibacter uratoxydans]GED04775.1 N-acetyltransferase [Glutamicibacter uratoxydans]